MNKYFGYTRVSTVKQGDGVSLEAQREAIEGYARKHGLGISAWFEEKETAAKGGRPVFTRVVTSLQRGEAAGLIIHKIDRSARNFTDWAIIGELLDSGIDVRFAHESLDMTSRGGRLTADIQAVIAADYVRNLREECLKGIEGRLKQGLFPFAAPIGYLDQGAGKPKSPDPERAPFVRQAFELYATQQYSIRGLLIELRKRGYRNRGGKPITKGCLENILSNPFYHGVILMKRTNQTYRGVHQPLISKELFDRVQVLKSNKQIKKSTVHNHTYRRLISCGHCGRSLYGELQKGWVYMRCQTLGCPTKSIRQDQLEAEITSRLMALQINHADQNRLEKAMRHWLSERTKRDDRRTINLQLSKLSDREDCLTDALLDRLIDKKTYQERKNRLTEERCQLKNSLAEIGNVANDARLARNFLELAKNVSLTYQIADPQKKRRLTEILFSNRALTGQSLYLQPQKWLSDKECTLRVLCGGPDQVRTRTEQQIWEAIHEFEK